MGVLRSGSLLLLAACGLGGASGGGGEHLPGSGVGASTSFMTSGPCIPLVLEREDAVATLRQVIGSTDPAEAKLGTIRKLYAQSKEKNAIHASDSPENAAREVAFYFPEMELAASATRG